MKKYKLEEFLLPHEIGEDGKKLETPEEIDVEKLRKYVYGVLTDKEEAQEARDAAVTDKAAVQKDLDDLRTKNETDEERRVREQTQRDQEIADLRKKDQDRAKVEAIEDHFKDKGITSARAKKLAKLVTGDDEKAWTSQADELVEDGFRISDKAAEQVDETGDDDNDLVPVVKATRNGRQVVPAGTGKPRSIAEELDAAGIGQQVW